MLAVPLTTAVNVSDALSTSAAVNVPVAVGVPRIVLSTPPASETKPNVVPEITAASLAPFTETLRMAVLVSPTRSVIM